jgi:ABC-2 type transport system ATP-binding protein
MGFMTGARDAETEAVALQVDGISKDFDSIRAVDDVHFEVHRGEILGFLGPNGAGKTTSIRMVLGILRPDEGSIRSYIDGECPFVPKERTGYLPEERGLYADALVLETLAYFGELKGLSRSEARERAEAWLVRFDLVDWRKQKIEKLSKGMQQKVQFAAAVVHEPDLIVLDEPFSGLDPVNQDLLKTIIRQLRDRGAAILLSSHQMNQVEELCDRIFLIHRGRRVIYDGLDEIKAANGDHTVRIRFEGDPATFSRIGGAQDVRISGDRATFRLTDVSPDEFVRALPDSIVIRELSVERPSLHEVFVRTIGGDHDEAA